MSNEYSIKKMIIFIIVVVLILGCFYGITLLVVKNKNNKPQEENTSADIDSVTIDYERILVQNIFSQSEDTYYVFAYLNDDSNLSSYNSEIAKYRSLSSALKVYEIDLDDALNKNYVSENSDFDSEYPIFSETTLLKIENKEIAETYQGKDEINSKLTNLNSES